MSGKSVGALRCHRSRAEDGPVTFLPEMFLSQLLRYLCRLKPGKGVVPRSAAARAPAWPWFQHGSG